MVGTVFLSKNQNLFLKFIWYFITVFFLYGYICLGGAILSLITLIKLLSVINGLIKYVSFVLLLPMGYAFFRFILILSSTKYKWRFYRLSYYRLKTRGFSEKYFKYEMYEPCMRLIIKNLLNEFGFQSQYVEMKDKYIKVNYRVEDAKNRLLESVMHDSFIET